MKALDEVKRLFKEYKECARCPLLVKSRSSVVFGSGKVGAGIVILGESPGKEEDEQEIPFIGKSGKLLMQLLEFSWPDDEAISEIRAMPKGEKDEDENYFEALRDFLDDYFFWTNVTLCWPGEGNRPPTPKEIKECKDRLQRVIYAIDPMLIIAAGGTATSALVGKKVAITDKRGTIFDIEIKSPVTGKVIRYPMYAIFHPSYLARKGDADQFTKKKGDTYTTLQDIQYAFELMNAEYQSLYDETFPYAPRRTW